MKDYFLSFHYDDHGDGPLKLLDPEGQVLLCYDCRSGSIGEDGKVTFPPLPFGEYVIKTKPCDTTEENMYIEPPNGWKVRLFRRDLSGAYIWTHYLIHPAKHGTKGCIGLIGTDALPLRKKLEAILTIQAIIPLTVTKE